MPQKGKKSPGSGIYIRTEKHSLHWFKKGVPQSPEYIAKRMKKLLGMPRTKEWCDRISESHKGEKNPSFGRLGENSAKWIKDRTQLKKGDKRSTSANFEWIRQCKERDKEKCRMANDDCKGGLEVHHILSYKEFPELRLDINNGITLCHFHHPHSKEDVKNLSPYFQELVKTK